MQKNDAPIPEGCFFSAIFKGSIRYERYDLRVEIVALGGNQFHMMAFYSGVSYAGVMTGRDLFRRLRTMDVPFERGWCVYQWQI